MTASGEALTLPLAANNISTFRSGESLTQKCHIDPLKASGERECIGKSWNRSRCHSNPCNVYRPMGLPYIDNDITWIKCLIIATVPGW